jgi:hypothetical protein
MLEKLEILAKKTFLTGEAVKVLPTVIEEAAKGQNLSSETLLDLLLGNYAAALYITNVARKVSK